MEQPQGLEAAKRTHEAFFSPADISKVGIGWVVIARFKAGGRRIETGVFCVDAWCLGVKIAAFSEWSPLAYKTEIVDHYGAEEPVVYVPPARARKMVEQAVAYAASLGFMPHPDYKKACRVMGGIDASQCLDTFSFGKDGKPFYVRGPRETDEQVEQIVRQLERHQGEGQFNFLNMLPE